MALWGHRYVDGPMGPFSPCNNNEVFFVSVHCLRCYSFHSSFYQLIFHKPFIFSKGQNEKKNTNNNNKE